MEEERNKEVKEEISLGVFYPATEMHEESDPATQPLLCENRSFDPQTGTDGADAQTAVPQKLEGASSSGSDGSRHECPICSELFHSQGDLCSVLLNCDHVLCRRCTDAILKRAKDPCSLQCPFCRQTTPCPQWEVRRLQEELYGDDVSQSLPSGLTISAAPDGEAAATSLSCCFTVDGQLQVNRHTCGPCCTVRGQFLCFPVTGLLLLGAVLLGALLLGGVLLGAVRLGAVLLGAVLLGAVLWFILHGDVF